jgi:uncharacterized membrane protein
MGATRLAHLWDTLRSSLWFVPGVMAVGALLLARLVVYLDDAWVSRWTTGSEWIYSRSPAGARDLLSTVAASMITVAGLTFSIIIVALQLASSQFGPRVLRSYMRDRGSQVVLGTFIATFLYCLMVMRTISDTEGEEPRLAVSVAVALAVASLAVLIYFLHHSAASIHAPNVVATISRELAAGIDRLYPASIGSAPSLPVLPPAATSGAPIAAGVPGYVQGVDGDALMRLAQDADAVIRVRRYPGEFVWPDDVVLDITPAARASELTTARARDCIIVGDVRTAQQDIEFCFEQLVQVTLRALSPGYNDPLTAVGCIEHLGAALDRLLQRSEPAAARVDDRHQVRVIAPARPRARVVELTLTPIIESARGATLVLRRLAMTVEALAPRANTDEMRRVLAEQARLIASLIEDVGTPQLRAEVRGCCERASARLSAR